MQTELENLLLDLVSLNLYRASELVQNFKKTAVDQHSLALTLPCHLDK